MPVCLIEGSSPRAGDDSTGRAGGHLTSTAISVNNIAGAISSMQVCIGTRQTVQVCMYRSIPQNV